MGDIIRLIFLLNIFLIINNEIISSSVFFTVLKFLETFAIMKHMFKNIEKEGYSRFHIIIILRRLKCSIFMEIHKLA
jgi:hypothetical protein